MARSTPPASGTLGEWVYKMRTKANLRQDGLAVRAAKEGCPGFNQGSVSRWERNAPGHLPSIQQIRVIAQVTGASKRDLEAGLSLLSGIPLKVVGAVPAAMGA